MRHADNRALVRYWHALRAGRPCPRRAEVDPRHILCDIGQIFILEDLGKGNIRFRLAGSGLVDVFWMELRGMPIRAIMAAEARESMRALVAETLAEPGIGHAVLRRVSSDPRAPGGDWEMVLLPLRSDRGSVDRLIGALNPLEPAEAEASRPPLTFSIVDMAITPIETHPGLVAELAESAPPWIGAAEPAARGGRGVHLRSIEGGRAEPASTPALSRADLRVIGED
ncbi:MAG: PAS domain-containing protein [Pseudomonadota bacterium]